MVRSSISPKVSVFPRQKLAQRLTRISSRVAAQYGLQRDLEARRPDEAKTLDQLVPNGVEWSGEHGICMIIENDLSADTKLRKRLEPVCEAPPNVETKSAPKSWRTPSLAVLDIETCGFSSMPAFLVGILHVTADEIVMRQGLARDYAEEASLMEWSRECLSNAGGVVSFNGKSFDMRYLRERVAYHRLPEIDEPPHLDLLYVARRIWGGELPNCRLQTLETALFGQHRRGDIPGYAIPHVYHAFVDNGDARDLATVLEHNRLDIMTLAELLAETWLHTNETGNDDSEHEAE